jgi:hypothetical protein
MMMYLLHAAMDLLDNDDTICVFKRGSSCACVFCWAVTSAPPSCQLGSSFGPQWSLGVDSDKGGFRMIILLLWLAFFAFLAGAGIGFLCSSTRKSREAFFGFWNTRGTQTAVVVFTPDPWSSGVSW